ncbi:hypothetical protein FNYG_09990 [Fusarium nygamai]|uniref:Uncharacterized protein n=1 Tax=Gibberella nygamai TaxID=42673 RepID=A0A2K0W2T7_GIBNY|nr:hypothetical protein FNYG_09990 [Fusarium nygamai]
MNNIARICNTTAGPDMISLRQLYITTVRPIISHGCGAWFIYGDWEKVKYQVPGEVLKSLVSIQSQCLRIVTGALARTKGRTVNKDRKASSMSLNIVKKAMTKIAKQDAEELSRRMWSRHLEDCYDESPRFRSAALMDKAGWGPHNLKRYRGLSRAQSTMLIQCRTGSIA